mmetsp:Transcript_120215/g.383791  ORF Transcript_120215/g.383791 Transcript_120215/m.383791 type:complete len:513 (-) Transcript_120215:88-1626(-)
MTFDRTAPPDQRFYAPAVNLFEDFVAARIKGYTQVDESFGIWSSGGAFLFKGAIFADVYMGMASVPDLAGGCARASPEALPGFPATFEDSVFLSGPDSSTFFIIYDGGVQVSNSRWAFLPGTPDDFRVAKPKAKFGGNGNPIVFSGSGELGRFDGDKDDSRFSWAFGLSTNASSGGGDGGGLERLAGFEPLAWGSPYTRGAYLYSSDNFGVGPPVPAIVASDAASSSTSVGTLARHIKGEEACADYLYRTPPQFFCGTAFGRYGRWCGDGISLCECGAVDDARLWYRGLPPWSKTSDAAPCSNQWPIVEVVEARGRHDGSAGGAHGFADPTAPPGSAGSSGDPTAPPGECTFANPPTASQHAVWDPSCQGGGLGCMADGHHPECRYCGFGPYPTCPDAGAANKDILDSGSAQAASERAASSHRKRGYYEGCFAASCLLVMGILLWFLWTRRQNRRDRMAVHPSLAQEERQHPTQGGGDAQHASQLAELELGGLGEVSGDADDMKSRSMRGQT